MPSRRILAAALAGALVPAAALAAAAPRPASPIITLAVDARDVARHLLHVREHVPASSGTLALAYPEWIPGEHGPTGPVIDLIDLAVTAGGQRLAWRRDDVDLHLVRCVVPGGVDGVDVTFDFALTSSTAGYSSASSATDNLLLLSWNQVVLYPSGPPSDAIRVRAGLVLPAGWRWGSSLHGTARGDSLAFEPVTLTRLVDSPVLAGRHYRSVDLAPGSPVPYTLEMAADGEAALAMPDSQVTRYRALVREARGLFGGGHHTQYHFLLSLSDHVAHFGLEHGESSDDRTSERMWIDDALRLENAELMTHEFGHSWCGKYRRPAGLATPDFHQPMRDEMLWVYEGLNQYLGFVLAGRSGTRSPQESHDHLARVTAALDTPGGRTWRPLLDTAVEAAKLYESRTAWRAARRGVDFYDEGLLLWLEADVTIRERTRGERSFDDFCKRFFGGDGPAEIKPYTLDEIVADLNAVAPMDWATFLHERVDRVQPHPPLAGIERGGWSIAWNDTASAEWRARETADESLDETGSIGLSLGAKDGVIADVVPGTAAERAGLAPDMTLLGVNGRRWTADLLHEAIRGDRVTPVELLATTNDVFHTFRLDDRRGLRYPRLERNAAPDLLDAILAPHNEIGAR